MAAADLIAQRLPSLTLFEKSLGLSWYPLVNSLFFARIGRSTPGKRAWYIIILDACANSALGNLVTLLTKKRTRIPGDVGMRRTAAEGRSRGSAALQPGGDDR